MSDTRPHVASVRARFYLIIRLVVGTLVAAGGSLFLLRRMSTAAWGAFSIPLFVAQASQEILYRGYAAQLIRDPDEPTGVTVSIAYSGQLVVSALLAVLTIAVGAYEAQAYSQPGILILMIGAAAFQVCFGMRSVAIALLERRLDFRQVAIIEVTETTVFSGVCVFLAAVDAPVSFFACGFVAEGLLSVWWTHSTRKAYSASLSVSRLPLRDVYGGQMLAVSALTILASLVPQITMAVRGNLVALGHVQLAFLFYAFGLVLVQVPIRIGFVLFGRMSEVAERSQQAVLSVTLLAEFVSPAIVLVMLFAPRVVPALLGKPWLVTGFYTACLGPAFLIAAVFWPVLLPLATASGHPRIIVRALAVHLALYFTASLVALNFTGAGPIIGFSVGIPVEMVVTYFWLRRVGFPLRGLSKPLVWVIGAIAAGSLPLLFGDAMPGWLTLCIAALACAVGVERAARMGWRGLRARRFGPSHSPQHVFGPQEGEE